MINKRDLHFNIMNQVRELEKEFNRAPMALLLLNLNEKFDYNENTVKNGIDELLNKNVIEYDFCDYLRSC